MVKKSNDKRKIRASTVEGIFYPDKKSNLLALLRDLLNSSEIPAGKANTIITPHAAYQYSGSIAAAAFKAASVREVKLTVLLGPVHRESMEGILLPESYFFQTPLGQTPVNQTVIEELLTCSTKFYCNDIPHLEEHCLEVQLPFIQHLFPDSEIVPILMAESNPQMIKLLSNAIQLTFADKLDYTLFVISSNMTSCKKKAVNDKEFNSFLDLIKRKDWEGIIDGISRGHISSCGAGCIAAILSLQNLLRGSIEILKRGSSLEVIGGSEKMIYYAALAMTKEDGGLGIHTDKQ